MKLLMLYCAFTYGFELVKVVNILSDEEQMLMLKYDCFPCYLLPYIVAFIMFLFAPITFICEFIYNVYKIIKERGKYGN